MCLHTKKSKSSICSQHFTDLHRFFVISEKKSVLLLPMHICKQPFHSRTWNRTITEQKRKGKVKTCEENRGGLKWETISLPFPGFSWSAVVCSSNPPKRSNPNLPMVLNHFLLYFSLYCSQKPTLLGANLAAIADGVSGCCVGRQGRAVSVPISVYIYTYSYMYIYMYTYISIYISLSSLPLSVSLSKSNLYLYLYLYEISPACK